MKKTAAAVTAVCALMLVAGCAYLWAQHRAQAALQAVAEQIRAGVGPNGSFFYASSAVHPLSGSVDLSEVALRQPSGELFTAAHVTIVSGVTGKLSSLHATGLHISGLSGGAALTAASWTARTLRFRGARPGRP